MFTPQCVEMIAVGARSRTLVYRENALLFLGFLPQELWHNSVGLPQSVCCYNVLNAISTQFDDVTFGLYLLLAVCSYTFFFLLHA